MHNNLNGTASNIKNIFSGDSNRFKAHRQIKNNLIKYILGSLFKLLKIIEEIKLKQAGINKNPKPKGRYHIEAKIYGDAPARELKALNIFK